MFLIDERKAPQGAYAIFSAQRQHGDTAILEAQSLIEKTVADAPTLEAIAARVAMTRRTFIRRFKAATGITPREYAQRARIEAAKRRLETSRERVAEVAERVGYEDQAAFRRLFQRVTGLTPTDYRARYSALEGPAPRFAASVRSKKLTATRRSRAGPPLVRSAPSPARKRSRP